MNEQERAIKRLLLPAARDPREKFKELLEEFPELMNSPTRSGKQNSAKGKQSGLSTKSNTAASTTTLTGGLGSMKSGGDISGRSDNIATPTAENTATTERGVTFQDPHSNHIRTLAHSISLPEPFAQKGPSAIKTHTIYEERNGMNQLPVNPYKSWEEETRVMNNGVPSGAGLLLWRPREKVTSRGRFRASRSNHPVRDKLIEQKKLPFVSMT